MVRLLRAPLRHGSGFPRVAGLAGRGRTPQPLCVCCSAGGTAGGQHISAAVASAATAAQTLATAAAADAAAPSTSAAPIGTRLSDIPNARDLSEAFPSIRPGRVLRCANPSGASAADTSLLLDTLRIRDLIDLRAGEEVADDEAHGSHTLLGRAATRRYVRSWMQRGKAYPLPDQMPWQQPQLRQSDPPSSTSPSSPASPSPSSPPPAISAVRHHISLLERGRYYLALAARLPASTTLSALATALYDKPAARRLLLPYVNGGGLALLYEMLLESAQPELCATMDVVLAAAEAGHGVLFFCRAGKDRTGLVAALVLSTAGASDQQIVEDYARSNAYHKVALAGLESREELAGLDRAAFEKAPPEVMEATLRHMRSRYGSVAHYLTLIGFSPDKQRRLRERLTGEW